MNIGEVLRQAVIRLTGAGIDSPQREARLLLAETSTQAPASLMAWPENPVDPTTVKRFNDALNRRCDHEPLSRIIGRREFWSLDFKVTPDTLDPRPDTETLIEAALSHLDRYAALRILDLGTGTGCILLSLLHEFKAASGIGIDISSGAIETATSNAETLGLAERSQFIVNNWANGLTGKFDLVISNPPYIPSTAIGSLDRAVRAYDPIGALDGGEDGVDPYRVLAKLVPPLLTPNGLVILEIGQGQDQIVPEIFIAAGMELIELRQDLAAIPRAVVLRQRVVTEIGR